MNKHILTLLLGASITVPAQQVYTLEQLKDSALRHNMAIREAKYNIASAQQTRQEAFTKYFPEISGTGATFNAHQSTAKMTVNPSEALPASLSQSLAQALPAEAIAALQSPISVHMMKNGTIAGISAIWPVFTGGQIKSGNKLAQIGEDAALLQLKLSENEVSKQTEEYFWQWVSLESKMRTVDTVAHLLRDVEKDVTTAIKAGMALQNDLLQVQLRENETESQRIRLQNGISILRLLLMQYCGLKNEQFSLLAPSTLTATPEAESLEPLVPETSLRQTAEYQLLVKGTDAAKWEKKMAIGQQMPTVAVGAGYNYHNLLENNRTFGTAFATVSVPISGWWGGSHAIKRKTLALRNAEEQLKDKSELLMINMQNNRNSVTEAQQQLTIAQRSIVQAEENLRLHHNQYKAGTATMSNLLEAQALYQQALDSRTDAFARLQTQRLIYRQSIGR